MRTPLIQRCNRLSLPVSRWALLWTLVWTASSAQAYDWMIRHDYVGCAQCHADPSGGSLLTNYGRAQSEVLLRTRYGKVAEDEEPGRMARKLLGLVKLPDEVDVGADVRAMVFAALSDPPQVRFIPMQADLLGQVASGRLRLNVSLGLGRGAKTQPAMLAGSNDGIQLISRHHWIGLVLGEDEEWMLRLGRMNLPFGIRNTEHTSFVKVATRTSTNTDQQHGLSLAYNGAKWRGELMAILGNLQVSPPQFRERGYSGYAEFSPAEKLGLGLSSLITHVRQDPAWGGPTWRHAHGLFARWSPARSWALRLEGDFVLNSTRGLGSTAGWASQFQLDFMPVQGLHLILSPEAAGLFSPARNANTRLGTWLSVAWFFLPHLDLRLDGVWRNQVSPVLSPNELSAFLQLHAFL